MRTRGAELAEKLRSQIGKNSNTSESSSASKIKDFEKEMERQREGIQAFEEAKNKVKEEQRKQKKETKEEREQRELDEHKIKLQKQKDVVDLWIYNNKLFG